MEDFVMTKGAQEKKNISENFVSVTHESYKKKPKQNININDDTTYYDDIDPKRRQELEMKRLRWDIMKFGSSGFDKTTKKKANVQLAISLGAIPPKNRYTNYKRLQQKQKNRQKQEVIPERQSGLLNSLKPIKTKKKQEKRDHGILGVYGQVGKQKKQKK